MEKARQATEKMSDDSQAKLAQQREAMDAVGRSALAIGAIAAAAFVIAVKSAADFDQKMSNVQAATNETAENMDELRAAALQAGRDTAFSANEAADAVTELAKAGVATADILSGALTGALDLAAAGEISVARAAEIAATAMTQFGIEGSKVPHIADLLASGANNAQGGVEELSQALNQAGLVSAAAGLSIEETVAGLSAFASAGLLGSDAGTSFKSMLQRLTPISAEAKREMDKLGISAFDAKGEFIGLEEFAGNLRESMKDLTPEQRAASQAIIFGTDAVRASNVLYEQGAEGIAEWTRLVDDSGAAARTAAIKLDNLNGDLQILRGSFETALIEAGSGANDVLREMVQAATFLVNSFAQLPRPVLDAGLAFTAIAAAIGLTGGAAMLAVPRVAAFKAQLALAGVTAKGASLAIGAVGGAIGVALIAFSAFIAKQAELESQSDALKDSLNRQTGALTDYSRELIVANLNQTDAFEQAEKLGVSQAELTDVLYEGRDAWGFLRDAAAQNGTVTNLTRLEHERLRGVMDEQAGVLEEARKKWENATSATEDNESALADLSAGARDASGEIEDLSEQILNFGRAEIDARAAARDFQAAIDDATQAVKDNGATLDISTEAGRDNQTALDDIATSANKAAAAVYAQTGSVEETTAALAEGREQYIAVGVAMGLTRDEAIEYADALIATPDQVITEVELSGVKTAADQMANFIREWGSKKITVKFFADTFALDRAAAAAAARYTGQALAYGMADGGAVMGSGGPREDNVPIMASAGEHMLDAEDVKAMGGQSAVYRFREALHSGSSAVAAPVMVPASSSSSRSMSISIPVSVSAGAVGSERFLADTVTSAIRDAVQSGALPSDWQVR